MEEEVYHPSVRALIEDRALEQALKIIEGLCDEVLKHEGRLNSGIYDVLRARVSNAMRFLSRLETRH